MARSRRLVGFTLVGLWLAALFPVAVAAAAPPPRVVLVVGPVAGVTEQYRQWARAGAAEARRWTSDVVEIYSPDATWPTVRAALQGASIVVYLGHGNGFPSPYGPVLRRSVQDGFGLNPAPGQGDVAHQYFGEQYVADQVHLAPGAIVLLFHLCYASGLAEPGVPEGPLAGAEARVDNFAAGFLAAGANAVVADAYGSPATYMRQLLGNHVSIRTAWNRSPTANGNVFGFASTRTPGAIALMDPQSSSSGFSRSLVLAAGAGGTVPAGPPGGGTVPGGGLHYVLPPEPTAAPDAFSLGARPGTPAIAGVPQAGSTAEVDLPVDLPAGVTLATSYEIGTRWIPLDDAAAAAPVQVVTGIGPAASPAPSPVSSPSQSPVSSPSPSPSASPAVTAGGSPATPLDPTVVAPESASSRVDVAPAVTHGSTIAVNVTVPADAGRYLLEVTIHGRDGVALPWAVQASIPGVVVHVGSPGAAWLDAPPAMTATAATLTSVQVTVTNGEPTAWPACPTAAIGSTPAATPAGSADPGGCSGVRLVGRWLALTGDAPAQPMVSPVTLPAASAGSVWLAGTVPAVPGTYLLVLGLERPGDAGSFEIVGRPVAMTVTVAAAPLVPGSSSVAAP